MKGTRYAHLKKELENATISEIISQYNDICVCQNWNDPLGELYISELLERILSDATFSMIIVWRSINEWLEKPYISVQLGFDESYPVLDREGQSILENDPSAEYIIFNNDQLPDDDQRKVIFKFLHDSPIMVTLQIIDSEIVISHIDDLYILMPSQIIEGTEIKVPLTIYHAPDLHLLYLIIDNIRKKTYDIIDTYSREEEVVNEEFFNFPNNSFEIVPLPPVEEIIRKFMDKNQTNYPELWKKIHLTALKCVDLEKFSDWIWEVCKNLPCDDCKWHMLRYIQTHPPSNLIPKSEDCDINIAFYWSVCFHNEVNIRLGKPEYSYPDALEYYSSLI